jgi:subtilisin family serine protease
MRGIVLLSSALAAAAIARVAVAAPTQPGDGVSLVRALGPHALQAFSPRGASAMGALVRLPSGVSAQDWGLRPAAPTLGGFWGSPSALLTFADGHPGAHIEVMPPLHTLLDTALGYVDARGAGALGLDGTGVSVGIADTGIDVTHGDFLDASGHTRVAWLLDLSALPRGAHADLEDKFGAKDQGGTTVTRGAVWSAADIDEAIANGPSPPQDPSGHGTLVSSCAAGNGENGRSKYKGVAPGATLLVARITDASEDIANDDMLRGVAFLMDRAAALKTPVVVNLSIGTDFGPHDGSLMWEETLASYVGPAHPGRAIVVAAGNSGSIADAPIHQNVHVSQGTRLRVPVLTQGADSGGVQIWVSVHDHASLKVGLDSPSGTWIEPVEPGRSAGSSDTKAGIYNGSQASGSEVPAGSNGATIQWEGQWARGTYYVTLEGSGTVDLYLQASGDAAIPGMQASFADGVREGTIGLPATRPELIGVGCTVNKVAWTDIRDAGVGVPVPLLDPQGGEVDLSGARLPVLGEPCWFSGAGPTITGVFKPDIMAPGAAIVGALSSQAGPSSPTSIFSSDSCPSVNGRIPDPSCQQVDATHGVALGTSFSSPIVAGAIALMLQYDPALTQDELLAALQGGAHPLRGPAPFADQAGPGELDVMGAIDAIDRLRNPVTALPLRSASWMSLGSTVAFADGSTSIEGVIELRAAPGTSRRAPPADGFVPTRLTTYARIDGRDASGVVGTPVRRGPGVWAVTVQPPSGLGGSSLTVGARFDGVDVVTPVSLPIATDAWTALYPSSIQGGCSVGRVAPGGAVGALAAAWLLIGRIHRRRANRGKAQRLGV